MDGQEEMDKNLFPWTVSGSSLTQTARQNRIEKLRTQNPETLPDFVLS